MQTLEELPPRQVPVLLDPFREPVAGGLELLARSAPHAAGDTRTALTSSRTRIPERGSAAACLGENGWTGADASLPGPLGGGMCPAFWAAPEKTVPRPPASGRHTPSHQHIGTAVLPPDSVVSPLAQTICPGQKCRVPPNRAPPGEQAHGSTGRAGPAHRALSTPV